MNPLGVRSTLTCATIGRPRAPWSFGLAAAACLLTACERDASGNLERGDRLLALGQYKQAVVEYQTALALERSAHAERGLGLAYEALSAFIPAEQHLEAALDAKPEDAEARVALARVYTHFGHYDRARRALLETLERAPDHPSALLLFAVYAEAEPELLRALDLLEGSITRERSAGRKPSREAELVHADLLSRLGRESAVVAVREQVKYVPLASPRLTLDLARAAADRRNYALARELLVPLVEREPTHAVAWQTLAEASIELGSFAEARSALGHLKAGAHARDVLLLEARLALADAQETRPIGILTELTRTWPAEDIAGRARVRRYLATALLEQRNYDGAEAELARLLAERADDLEGGLLLAQVWLSRGNVDRAIPLLEQLAERHVDSAAVHATLGRAYLGTAQLERAEKTFSKLVAQAPREPDGAHWLAVTLGRAGQPERAREVLEQNLRRSPDHTQSLRALAGLLEERSGVAAAKAFVLTHGRAHPDSKAVATTEADWLLEHGDPERALAAYRRALLIDPGYLPAATALSRFYARHGRTNLAEAVLDRAVTSAPERVDLLVLAARVSSELSQYDAAQKYCERGLATSPDHPSLLAELAIVLSEGSRELVRARELAARAYAVAPSRAEVLDALGWVSYLAGDPDKARSLLELAERRAPDEPRIVYHHGAVLAAAGQAAASSAKLSRVVSLDPLFPGARGSLAAHR